MEAQRGSQGGMEPSLDKGDTEGGGRTVKIIRWSTMEQFNRLEGIDPAFETIEPRRFSLERLISERASRATMLRSNGN